MRQVAEVAYFPPLAVGGLYYDSICQAGFHLVSAVKSEFVHDHWSWKEARTHLYKKSP